MGAVEVAEKDEAQARRGDFPEFASLTVDELLTEPPPQRALLTYVRQEEWSKPQGERKPPQVWLPRGVVAILAAAGGTGKSQLCLQLAVAVATGGHWCGYWSAAETGPVCIVVGEDTLQDIRARLYALKLTRDEAAAFAERVHIMPTSGVDARWTDQLGAPTVAFAALRERIAEKAPALVILDPGSRFFGPEVETDNGKATTWIRQAEELQRIPSGPAVLVAMHTRKPQSGGKRSGLEQSAVRGSSALVDGARWVATLDRVSERGAPVDLMRLERVKVNNCPPDDGARVLERVEGGRIRDMLPGSWAQWKEWAKDHDGDGELTEARAFNEAEAFGVAERDGRAREYAEAREAADRKAKRRG